MIILIDGDNGTGKSLLLAKISQKIQRPLWSNFTLLNHPYYKPLELHDILNLSNYAKQHADTGLVAYVDEAYTWLEARLSSQTTNIFLSYNTNYQWRKRHLDIYLAFQDFFSIDVRYRIRFDIFIECQYRDYDSEEDFVYNYFRWKRNAPNKRKTLYTRRYSFNYMKQFFPLFDTYEIVEPLNKARMEYNIAKKNPSYMKKQLVKYTALLTPQVKQKYNGSITHEKLELLLIDNEILPEYEKKIYNILKYNYKFN